MKYKYKTKEQLINELAEPHQPIKDLAARETGRRQADEALKVSETRYRRLFETAQDGIVLLEPARVERGCLSYCLYEDVENRNAFVLLEEWATQEDLESHIRTDNQRRLLALMDLLSDQPELRFNTVSHTAGMDLIENALKTSVPG